MPTLSQVFRQENDRIAQNRQQLAVGVQNLLSNMAQAKYQQEQTQAKAQQKREEEANKVYNQYQLEGYKQTGREALKQAELGTKVALTAETLKNKKEIAQIQANAKIQAAKTAKNKEAKPVVNPYAKSYEEARTNLETFANQTGIKRTSRGITNVPLNDKVYEYDNGKWYINGKDISNKKTIKELNKVKNDWDKLDLAYKTKKTLYERKAPKDKTQSSPQNTSSPQNKWQQYKG